MRLTHAWPATALIALLASVASPQAPVPNAGRDLPVFRSQVSGYIVADFTARVSGFVELRSTLEKGLPPLRVTDDPAEIAAAQRALAQRIRVAREDAREGDIFTPAISAEFKNVLQLEMNAGTWEAIMDDNPGESSHRGNRTYPRGEPFSTMPANILAALPRLPDDIQYRFLGRHLILLDMKSNLILDRIPCAIRSTDERDCHR